MSAVPVKVQKYSSQEDTYLVNFREWRNGKVSESWAQFLARYEKKFWIDPHSPASLFRRASRLSGQRYQTLFQDGEMMQHMLKIRRSSLLWTWGRIGQAFGTNARTVSEAYKLFLERHEINEVENELGRIRWTKSEIRRLNRARHLGYSWERIAKKFGYEEYICIAAHYIHSYGELKSGNLNMSFHPKCFFSPKEKSSMYPIQKASTIQGIKDENPDENLITQDKIEPSSSKSDSKASGSGSSQLDLSNANSMKRKSTSGCERNHEIMNNGPTKKKQQSHAGNGMTTAATPRRGTRADTLARTTTPTFKRRVAGMRINEARASSKDLQAHNTRPSGMNHRSVLSPKCIVNIDTKSTGHLFTTVRESRRISKSGANTNINTNINTDVTCFKVKLEPKDDEDENTKRHTTSGGRKY
ncbi:hypothetical protein NHQ30_003578 [Ciborinia camelliae]|nr:hypothetical protein NHQ30_003578 [Ciborinia camelliae]